MANILPNRRPDEAERDDFDDAGVPADRHGATAPPTAIGAHDSLFVTRAEVRAMVTLTGESGNRRRDDMLRDLLEAVDQPDGHGRFIAGPAGAAALETGFGASRHRNLYLDRARLEAARSAPGFDGAAYDDLAKASEGRRAGERRRARGGLRRFFAAEPSR